MTLPLHSFHIPVMGLAYTIDSPIKVAQYGISSVISIIEDRLIEMMRKHYYEMRKERYVPITTKETDYRAKRITDYLNLTNLIVQEQITELRSAEFKAGNKLSDYFEMLPKENTLHQLYCQMVQVTDPVERESLQVYLKSKIVAGSIDVNIMTKVDGNNSGNKGSLKEDGTDAVTALRGYALSSLTNSSLVFSAGLNPRLFNYLETLESFDARGLGVFDKKIVIKVSDYRSALIQGKYLAKKGIWVSEFRIESGLNCGGHAFATDGYLMGPILEEFKTKREELISILHQIYSQAIKAKGKVAYNEPHPIKITAQGGVGTADENKFLLSYYNIDSVGWGTPFLLCPEATTVDNTTLDLLAKAGKTDIVLSNNSPLGVRFHYLRGTSSENEKLYRIKQGIPGSPCTEKHLAFNTEFTSDPICTASRKYQKLKIAQLKSQNLTEQDYTKHLNDVYSKECLCVGLSNSASLAYEQPFLKRRNSVNICPGPNLAYFSKVVSLKQMTNHIYGDINLLEDVERAHVFINELRIYITYLKEQLEQSQTNDDMKQKQYCKKFVENLLEGIRYYQSIGSNITHPAFLHDLQNEEEELHHLIEKSLLLSEEALIS